MIIYTDGSCKNNGKKNASGGIGIYFSRDNDKNLSLSLPGDLQTNNRAELFAILVALQIIQDNYDEPIVICTDSKYSINSLTLWMKKWKTNHWMSANKKPVLNKDLLLQINDILEKHINITFRHIIAHTDNNDPDSIGNREADRLATLASISHR